MPFHKQQYTFLLFLAYPRRRWLISNFCWFKGGNPYLIYVYVPFWRQIGRCKLWLATCWITDKDDHFYCWIHWYKGWWSWSKEWHWYIALTQDRTVEQPFTTYKDPNTLVEKRRPRSIVQVILSESILPVYRMSIQCWLQIFYKYPFSIKYIHSNCFMIPYLSAAEWSFLSPFFHWSGLPAASPT